MHRTISELFLIRRSKRGLINLGGKILKEIFGVMDEKDSEMVEKQISTLKNSNKLISHIMQKQTFIMKNSIQLIGNNTQQLDYQYKLIEQLMQNMLNLTTLQELNHYFDEMSNIMLSAIFHITKLQNNILNSLASAQQNRLDLKVIDPHTLMEALEKIPTTAQGEFKFPIKPSIENVYEVIQFLDVTVKHSANRLLYEITLPLTTADKYILNQIHSVPILYRDNLFYYANQAFLKPSIKNFLNSSCKLLVNMYETYSCAYLTTRFIRN